MSNPEAVWKAAPKPEWVRRLNEEGETTFDMPSVIPLDPDSLLHEARRKTGLNDMGEDIWVEPFHILTTALEAEAKLTLMGRLMARNDIIVWLSTRLQVVDTLKRHPEILEEEITAPMFIVGLPRSGTSILFELLAQDPEVGVPLTWEAMMPCPPPEAASYDSDPRIERAHNIVTQWSRVAPEFATMHEMGGRIPSECGQIMCATLVSDQIAALHQTHSYSAWLATADYLPVYEFHKQVLQILQWKNPRKRWLLKAPEHQVHLETLLQVYPDARIVQTHRDPIKCMASTTSLIGTIYSMRTDQPFDAGMFENIVKGEATSQRLERVMDQRASGVVPAENITDSRYQDLMDEPMQCIENTYSHFGMELSDIARESMLKYLEDKPKGKFGKHQYEVDDEKARERALFLRYQEHYNVPFE